MATDKTMKKKPVEKTNVVNSIKVVDKGVRKAHSIRKFQDSYYVGIAYVGLMELTMESDEPNWHGGGKTIRKVDYRGEASTETPNAVVRVYGWLRAEQATNDPGRHYYSDYSDYGDSADNYPPENRKLWGENMAGITESTFEGGLIYEISDVTKGGKDKRIYNGKTGQFYAIEDCLDAMTRLSEEAWGEVTIALSDYADAVDDYNLTLTALPETVTINTKFGSSINAKVESSYYGMFYSVDDWIYEAGDGIFVKIDGRILPRNLEDKSITRENVKDIDYYEVRVTGTIADDNTQVSYKRNDYRRDEWNRVFEGEGAETLEGAIAIFEQNVAEVIQEANDYVASVRDYQTIGHGVGYQRTTENVNDWAYNFGDSADDVNYEDWLMNVGETFDYNNFDNDYSDRRDYYAKQPLSDMAYTFKQEYVGTEYGIIDYDQYRNPVEFYPSRSSSNEDGRQKFLETHTRDDVERVAGLVGLKVIDYEDPLNFKLTASARKGVRKGRCIKKPYYDVEAKALAKSRKPKTFTQHVNAVRKSNYKRMQQNRRW